MVEGGVEEGVEGTTKEQVMIPSVASRVGGGQPSLD